MTLKEFEEFCTYLSIVCFIAIAIYSMIKYRDEATPYRQVEIKEPWSKRKH